MKTFIHKLVAVQSDLKAKKSQWNEFGKYHYRKAEDILEAVKPLLKEHDLFLTITDTIEMVGARFYVKATATITDGEFEKCASAYAREEESKKGMDGSQVTGASSSYARKYALNGLFGIDDTADSDGTNDGKPESKQPEQKQPASQQQQQAKSTSKENSKTPALLDPEREPDRWKRVVEWLTDKGKTEEHWPDIKKSYIISEASESKLFEQMGWLPF